LWDSLIEFSDWAAASEESDRFSKPAEKIASFRICRFELMEPRQLLAVDVLPIQIGAVYTEDASDKDLGAGDTFEITFSGGAVGTQLTQLSIETDKESTA